MYAQIVVALDGSPLAEQVLPYVEALATRFGSTVTLLRAIRAPGTIIAETTAPTTPVAGPVVDPTPIVEAERQEAAHYLESLADRLREQGLTIKDEVSEGPAAQVIVQRAQALGADLIAMTTHGRGGLGRLVFGSVADAVLRSAACPILLVRLNQQEHA
jgi:nucleotide-binding universal stress UspA family protein